MLRNHEPFGFELRNGLSYGHSSHSIVLDELCLGRHATTRLQVASLDCLAQLVCYLTEWRGVRQPVDRAEFMHRASSSSLVVL
jgi:hypothetical protein